MLKFLVSESQNYFPLNEENLMSTYCQLSLELRVDFLSKFIKPSQYFSYESLSFPTSIFNCEVQFVVTILSQILGLENDRSINEIIIGFLVTMCSIEENQAPQLQVVEFLDEAIHVQLVFIDTLTHFRYQAYIMHLFFHFNHEHFPELQRHEQPTPEISFVNKDNNEAMFRFINQVMPKSIYVAFWITTSRNFRRAK